MPHFNLYFDEKPTKRLSEEVYQHLIQPGKHGIFSGLVLTDHVKRLTGRQEDIFMTCGAKATTIKLSTM